jgi:hypothetical protein
MWGPMVVPHGLYGDLSAAGEVAREADRAQFADRWLRLGFELRSPVSYSGIPCASQYCR